MLMSGETGPRVPKEGQKHDKSVVPEETKGLSWYERVKHLESLRVEGDRSYWKDGKIRGERKTMVN